jgi:hypothetical protein
MSNTVGSLANWMRLEGKSEVRSNMATKFEEEQQIKNERNSRCYEHLGARVNIVGAQK